jgi:hypothetical protein
MCPSDSDQTCAAETDHYRDLWVAVVLQAKADIETEPLNSIDFTQSVAFFIGSGDWVQNRIAIADYLNLHRDDLEKLGRRCINLNPAFDALPDSSGSAAVLGYEPIIGPLAGSPAG